MDVDSMTIPSFALALILQPVKSDIADTYERVGLAQLTRIVMGVQEHRLWPTKELIII